MPLEERKNRLFDIARGGSPAPTEDKPQASSFADEALQDRQRRMSAERGWDVSLGRVARDKHSELRRSGAEVPSFDEWLKKSGHGRLIEQEAKAKERESTLQRLEDKDKGIFGRALRRGFQQYMLQPGYGLAGMAGSVIAGKDQHGKTAEEATTMRGRLGRSMVDWAQDKQEFSQQKIQRAFFQNVESIKDIDSPGKFLQWGAENIVTLLPMAARTAIEIAAGGWAFRAVAGGAMAAGALRHGATHGAGKVAGAAHAYGAARAGSVDRIAAGIVKKNPTISLEAAKNVAAKHFERSQVQKAIAAVSIGPATYTPSMFMEVMQEHGIENVSSAVAFGLGASATTWLAPGQLRAIQNTLGHGKTQMFQSMIRRGDMKGAAGIAIEAAKVGGMSMVEEFGQESLALANLLWNDEQYEIGDLAQAYWQNVGRPLESALTIGVATAGRGAIIDTAKAVTMDRGKVEKFSKPLSDEAKRDFGTATVGAEATELQSKIANQKTFLESTTDEAAKARVQASMDLNQKRLDALTADLATLPQDKPADAPVETGKKPDAKEPVEATYDPKKPETVEAAEKKLFGSALLQAAKEGKWAGSKKLTEAVKGFEGAAEVPTVSRDKRILKSLEALQVATVEGQTPQEIARNEGIIAAELEKFGLDSLNDTNRQPVENIAKAIVAQYESLLTPEARTDWLAKKESKPAAEKHVRETDPFAADQPTTGFGAEVERASAEGATAELGADVLSAIVGEEVQTVDGKPVQGESGAAEMGQEAAVEKSRDSVHGIRQQPVFTPGRPETMKDLGSRVENISEVLEDLYSIHKKAKVGAYPKGLDGAKEVAKKELVNLGLAEWEASDLIRSSTTEWAYSTDGFQPLTAQDYLQKRLQLKTPEKDSGAFAKDSQAAIDSIPGSEETLGLVQETYNSVLNKLGVDGVKATVLTQKAFDDLANAGWMGGQSAGAVYHAETSTVIFNPSTLERLVPQIERLGEGDSTEGRRARLAYFVEIAGHELGHHIQASVLQKASFAEQQAVLLAYENWKNSQTGKSSREIQGGRGLPARKAVSRNRQGQEKDSVALQEYALDFAEWFADEAAKYIVGKELSSADKQAVGLIARFADMIKALYRELTGNDLGAQPDVTVKAFLDKMWKAPAPAQQATEQDVDAARDAEARAAIEAVFGEADTELTGGTATTDEASAMTTFATAVVEPAPKKGDGTVTLMSGFGPTTEQWEAAKPYFQKSWNHFKVQGKKAADWFKSIAKSFGDAVATWAKRAWRAWQSLGQEGAIGEAKFTDQEIAQFARADLRVARNKLISQRNDTLAELDPLERAVYEKEWDAGFAALQKGEGSKLDKVAAEWAEESKAKSRAVVTEFVGKMFKELHDPPARVESKLKPLTSDEKADLAFGRAVESISSYEREHGQGAFLRDVNQALATEADGQMAGIAAEYDAAAGEGAFLSLVTGMQKRKGKDEAIYSIVKEKLFEPAWNEKDADGNALPPIQIYSRLNKIDTGRKYLDRFVQEKTGETIKEAQDRYRMNDPVPKMLAYLEEKLPDKGGEASKKAAAQAQLASRAIREAFIDPSNLEDTATKRNQISAWLEAQGVKREERTEEDRRRAAIALGLHLQEPGHLITVDELESLRVEFLPKAEAKAIVERLDVFAKRFYALAHSGQAGIPRGSFPRVDHTEVTIKVDAHGKPHEVRVPTIEFLDQVSKMYSLQLALEEHQKRLEFGDDLAARYEADSFAVAYGGSLELGKTDDFRKDVLDRRKARMERLKKYSDQSERERGRVAEYGALWLSKMGLHIRHDAKAGKFYLEKMSESDMALIGKDTEAGKALSASMEKAIKAAYDAGAIDGSTQGTVTLLPEYGASTAGKMVPLGDRARFGTNPEVMVNPMVIPYTYTAYHRTARSVRSGVEGITSPELINTPTPVVRSFRAVINRVKSFTQNFKRQTRDIIDMGSSRIDMASDINAITGQRDDVVARKPDGKPESLSLENAEKLLEALGVSYAERQKFIEAEREKVNEAMRHVVEKFTITAEEFDAFPKHELVKRIGDKFKDTLKTGKDVATMRKNMGQYVNVAKKVIEAMEALDTAYPAKTHKGDVSPRLGEDLTALRNRFVTPFEGAKLGATPYADLQSGHIVYMDGAHYRVGVDASKGKFLAKLNENMRLDGAVEQLDPGKKYQAFPFFADIFNSQTQRSFASAMLFDAGRKYDAQHGTMVGAIVSAPVIGSDGTVVSEEHRLRLFDMTAENPVDARAEMLINLTTQDQLRMFGVEKARKIMQARRERTTSDTGRQSRVPGRVLTVPHNLQQRVWGFLQEESSDFRDMDLTDEQFVAATDFILGIDPTAIDQLQPGQRRELTRIMARLSRRQRARVKSFADELISHAQETGIDVSQFQEYGTTEVKFQPGVLEGYMESRDVEKEMTTLREALIEKGLDAEADEALSALSDFNNDFIEHGEEFARENFGTWVTTGKLADLFAKLNDPTTQTRESFLASVGVSMPREDMTKILKEYDKARDVLMKDMQAFEAGEGKYAGLSQKERGQIGFNFIRQGEKLKEQYLSPIWDQSLVQRLEREWRQRVASKTELYARNDVGKFSGDVGKQSRRAVPLASGGQWSFTNTFYESTTGAPGEHSRIVLKRGKPRKDGTQEEAPIPDGYHVHGNIAVVPMSKDVVGKSVSKMKEKHPGAYFQSRLLPVSGLSKADRSRRQELREMLSAATKARAALRSGEYGQMRAADAELKKFDEGSQAMARELMSIEDKRRVVTGAFYLQQDANLQKVLEPSTDLERFFETNFFDDLHDMAGGQVLDQLQSTAKTKRADMRIHVATRGGNPAPFIRVEVNESKVLSQRPVNRDGQTVLEDITKKELARRMDISVTPVSADVEIRMDSDVAMVAGRGEELGVEEQGARHLRDNVIDQAVLDDMYAMQARNELQGVQFRNHKTFAQTKTSSPSVEINFGDGWETYSIIPGKSHSMVDEATGTERFVDETVEGFDRRMAAVEAFNNKGRTKARQRLEAELKARGVATKQFRMADSQIMMPLPGESKVDKAKAQKTADEVLKLSVGMKDQKVVIHDSWQSLPQSLQADIAGQTLEGMHGLVMAWTDANKTIHILADRHHTDQDVIRSVLHEAVAHNGLYNSMPKDVSYEVFLDSVWKQHRDEAQAALHRIVPPYFADLNFGSDEIARKKYYRMAAEEVVGRMVETAEIDAKGNIVNKQIGTYLDRMISFVIRGLRKLGLYKGKALRASDTVFSKAEIREIIGKAFKGPRAKFTLGLAPTVYRMFDSDQIYTLDQYANYERKLSDQFNEGIRDGFRPIQQLANVMKRAGIALSDREDAYGAAGIYRSRTSAHQFNLLMEKHFKPLMAQLEGMRLVEKGGKTPGLDKYISDFKTHRGDTRHFAAPKGSTHQKMESVLKRIHDINMATIDIYRTFGLRAEHDLVQMEGYKTDQRFLLYPPFMQSDTIRETFKAGQTLHASLAQLQAAISFAHKNDVKLRLYNMLNLLPDSERGKFFREIKEPALDPSLASLFGVDTAKEDTSSQFVVWDQGTRRTVEVHSEHLMRAVNALSPGQLNKVLQYVAQGNRVMASLLIKYNPFFWPVNLMRDSATAVAHLHVGGGAMGLPEGIAKKVAKGIPGAMKSLNAYKKGETKDVGGIRKDVFDLYMEMGVQTGYSSLAGLDIDQADLSNIESAMAQYADTPWQGALKAWDAIERTVSRYNEVCENASRIALMQELIDDGMTPHQASLHAKNLTVNFDRRGNWRWLNAMHLFFNAAVQGPAATASWLTKNPGGAKKMIYGIVAAGFMMTELARMGLGEDENGEEEWNKINDFTKGTSIIIPTGDRKFLRIPKPYVFGFFWDIGMGMSDMLRGKGPLKTMFSLVDSMGLNFAPTGMDVDFSKGAFHENFVFGFTKLMSPTITDPVIDLLYGKSGFGSPIFHDKEADALQNMKTAGVYLMRQWGGGTGDLLFNVTPATAAAIYEGRYGDLASHRKPTKRFYSEIGSRYENEMFRSIKDELEQKKSDLTFWKNRWKYTQEPTLKAEYREQYRELKREWDRKWKRVDDAWSRASQQSARIAGQERGVVPGFTAQARDEMRTAKLPVIRMWSDLRD